LLLSYTVNHFITQLSIFSLPTLPSGVSSIWWNWCVIWRLPDPWSKALISLAIANTWWKHVFHCIFPFPHHFKKWALLQDYILFLSAVCHTSISKIISLSLKTIAAWFSLLQNGYKSKQLFKVYKVRFWIKIIWSIHLRVRGIITTRFDTEYELQHNMLKIQCTKKYLSCILCQQYNHIHPANSC
jgi:hypothetical protein